MLELDRLEVEGFGPYAERQELAFSRDPGVTLIYGANMRGKTSLLNAMRYAFYGKVRGRGATERELHSVSNRDLASRGLYGFEVALSFRADGIGYELTRECRARSSDLGFIPRSDEDYRQELMVRRGPNVLSPQQARTAIAQVLPEQVSRFFLFDGELLQEYEELVLSQSDAGRRISEAIERILGVPVLRTARSHLKAAAEQAEQGAAREAARTQETQSIGNALQSASDMKEHHKHELERKLAELGELKQERDRVERYLQSKERYAAIIAERDERQNRLSVVRRELEQATTELRSAMEKAWRTVIAERVRAARIAASHSARAEYASLTRELRRAAVMAGHCGVCERDLDGMALDRLRDGMAGESGPETRTGSSLARLEALSSFEERDVSKEVALLARRLDDLAVEQSTLEDAVRDLQTELQDADIDEIRSSARSFPDLVRKIVIVEEAVKQERAKVDEADENMQTLSKRLEGLGTADLRVRQTISRTLREAAEVFDAAIAGYKRGLRTRVQATASAAFLRMTTEPDEYARLEINDDYGLEIIHRDGAVERNRSAGAEHVIALALMTALQQNAPLRGPIVMDYPFGRLDPQHRRRVLEAIPSMASQVVLLIHEGELERGEIRTILRGGLRGEYELVRESARRTRIEPVR